MKSDDTINYPEMTLREAQLKRILPPKLAEFLMSSYVTNRSTIATLGRLYETYLNDPEFLSQYKTLQSKGKKFDELQILLIEMFEKPEFDSIKELYNPKTSYSSEEVNEIIDMLDKAEHSKHKAQLDAERTRTALAKSQAQIVALKSKLAAPPTLEKLLPDDLSIIGEWTSTLYPNRFLITPRALNEVQDSKYNVYENPQKVFFGLSALATDFREARLLDGKTQQELVTRAEKRFNARLASQGISDDHSLTKTAASRFGQLYKAQVDDTSYVLNRHLKHGVSRDPKTIMRVYYAFDADSGQIVVGSLPRHLKNSLT